MALRSVCLCFNCAFYASIENCKLLSGSSQFVRVIFFGIILVVATQIKPNTQTTSTNTHIAHVATSQALNYLLHCKLCFRYCDVGFFFAGRENVNVARFEQQIQIKTTTKYEFFSGAKKISVASHK